MDAEENQKQVSLRAHSPWKSLCDSHISTAPAIIISISERSPGDRPLRSLLQAHSWMRKCFPAGGAGLSWTGSALAKLPRQSDYQLELPRGNNGMADDTGGFDAEEPVGQREVNGIQKIRGGKARLEA